jgi:peptidoglycan/xylan/chitin deacetylase (PgdA/CDA1 family)
VANRAANRSGSGVTPNFVYAFYLHPWLGFPVAGRAATAQTTSVWQGKQCAVVLTYDDAIDVDLDNALPTLDSLKLRGTFYLIGSAPAVSRRLGEWRRAAQHGHELGNHALFHPCDGSLPGRGFVTPDNDLSKYTVSRAVAEIRANNTLLHAIDGKTAHTFAYPCGDRQIGGVYFYDQLKPDFVAARGVTSGLQTAAQVDLTNVDCYMINGQDSKYMIDLVKQAQQTHTLLVFLFHGVGGGHSLNVDLAAHRQLLHYLKAHEHDIDIAPMVEVAERIRAYQQGSAARK